MFNEQHYIKNSEEDPLVPLDLSLEVYVDLSNIKLRTINICMIYL